MDIKRFFTLLLIIFIFIVCISNVYAGDNLNESEVYHIDSNNGDINSILNISKSSKSIYLSSGNYGGSNNTGLYIEGNVSLIGENSSNTFIDAKGLSRIFTISSNSTVSFINLTFINGFDNYCGGAICNYGNLSLINCFFTSNSVYATVKETVCYGGAVFNEGFLYVENSSFISNSVGSSYQDSAYGGAIYNVGLLSVNNSYFKGNKINFCGKYDKDKYNKKGGAIASFSDNATIFNCTFESHSLVSSPYSINSKEYLIMAGEGGAVYIEGDNITLLNCVFSNNRADFGGAVSFAGNNIIIDNCSFLRNSAYVAGALSSYDFYKNSLKYISEFMTTNVFSNLSINNCEFRFNNLIHSTYRKYFEDTFTSLIMGDGCGGAVFLKIDNISCVNSTFSSNYLDSSNYYSQNLYGGAAYTIGRNVLFDNCSFSDNTASSGGALFTRGISTSILNCSFIKNEAMVHEGGAIFHTAGDYLTVIDSYFKKNSAKDDGGAIYSVTRLNYHDESELTNHYSFYSNITFISNSAAYGGAVYDNGDYSSFYNSTFMDNKAKYGGATYNHGLSNSYYNVTFKGNTADGEDYSNGGAVYNYGSLSRFEFCDFINNYADNMGGAIYNSGHDVYVSNSSFTDNNAFKGGAIHVKGKNGRIESNCFNNNLAVYGGALYNEGLNLIVTFNNFSSDKANVTGGGIYNTVDGLILYGNLMEDCHSRLSGVGYGDYIYTKASIAYLSVSFMNNETLTLLDGSDGVIFANVTDNMGNPVTGGNVSFVLYDESKDESIDVGIATLWEGIAYIGGNKTYDYGRYIIMGSYSFAGSPLLSKKGMLYSLVSTKLYLTTDKDLNEVYGGDLNYELVLLDSNDEYVDCAEIKVFDYGTYVFSIFTDDAGKVNESITHLLGSYNYLFYYGGDLTHDSTSAVLNFTVKQNAGERIMHDVIFTQFYPIIITSVNSTIPFEFSMQYNATIHENGTVYHEIMPLAEIPLSHFSLYRDDELINISSCFIDDGYDLNSYYDQPRTYTSGNFILEISDNDVGIHVYRLEFRESSLVKINRNPFLATYYGDFNAFNSSFLLIINSHNASIPTSLDVSGPLDNISEVDFANYSISLNDVDGNMLGDRLIKVYEEGVYLGEFKTSSNSTVNFEFSNYLEIGNHLIEFVYGGDENYSASYEAFFLNVFENPNKIPTEFINLTNLNVVGEYNNFTAYLVGDDSTKLNNTCVNVLITSNSTILYNLSLTTDDEASFTIPLDFGSGTFNFTCTYNGNKFYQNNTCEFNVVVNKTPTILFGSNDLIVVGENNYLNYVLIDEDFTILSNRKIVIDVYSNQFNRTYHAFSDDSGACKLKITLPVGEYFIFAYFEGEKWYGESNVVLTNLTVYGDYSRLITDSNIIIKNSGYYTVKLTDSKGLPLSDKKLIISINGVDYGRITDEKGMARLKINLNYGRYNISSYFKGDLNYKYDYVSSNLLVVGDDYKFPTMLWINESLSFRANSQGFTSRLTDLSNNPLYNMSLTISINGKDYVGFTDNEGLVLWDLALPVGSYDAKIAFGGGGDFQKCNGDFHLTIVPSNASTSILSAQIYSIIKGKGNYYNVTLKDKLDNPIKNQPVKFTVNGVTYARITNDFGVASLKIDLNAGSYDVYCRFDGSNEYYYSELYSKIVVLNPVTLKLTRINANNSLSIIGKGKYAVSLTDLDDNPLANCNVTIIVNGISYVRTTNASGVASLNIALNPGNYLIYSVFKGDSEYRYSNLAKTSLNMVSPINGVNLVKYYKNDSQFYAKLTDFNGNPLVNANVSMNINGVFYTRKTNDGGIVKLNINLSPGEYILTLYYPEFSNIRSSFNITVLSTLIISDLYKIYKNGSQYEIKLLNASGGALSNANISININGVIYDRITDENGVARLNINLKKGRYIATVCDKSTGLLRSSNVVVWNNKPTFAVPKEASITKDNNFFSVNLKDGNDPMVGEPVKFSLNGVNYTQNCNKNGDARVKLTLNSGEYIIKSSYANMEELTLLRVK